MRQSGDGSTGILGPGLPTAGAHSVEGEAKVTVSPFRCTERTALLCASACALGDRPLPIAPRRCSCLTASGWVWPMAGHPRKLEGEAVRCAILSCPLHASLSSGRVGIPVGPQLLPSALLLQLCLSTEPGECLCLRSCRPGLVKAFQCF